LTRQAEPDAAADGGGHVGFPRLMASAAPAAAERARQPAPDAVV